MNLQYELSSEGYTAKISNLELYQTTEFQLVKAKHHKSYGKQQVTHVHITSSVVYVMPNIAYHFMNLSHLLIDNCGLSRMVMADFILLPGLNTLYLPNNEIESLPADLFEAIPHLTELSLRDNKIKFISKDTLTPLTRLKYADFRGNNFIDEIYDSTGKTTSGSITLCMLRAKIFVQCKPTSEEVSTVKSYVNRLWEGLLSDLKIIAKEEVFEVHKAVLAANSRVFADIFNHGLKENLSLNEMTMDKVSTESVKEFLTFVYLRELPKKCFNAFDLYELAEQYQIKELSEQMQWHISMEANAENASEMFKIGVHHNNEIVKLAAFRAIEESFNRKLPIQLLKSTDLLMELLDAKDKVDKALRKIDTEFG